MGGNKEEVKIPSFKNFEFFKIKEISINFILQLTFLYYHNIVILVFLQLIFQG